MTNDKPSMSPARICIAIGMGVALSFPSGISADASGNKAIAPLKPDMPYLFVVHNGRSFKVERDLDKSFIAPPETRSVLLRTSEQCPPFCLRRMSLDIPVKTVGEVEIIDFMNSSLRDSKGLLIDVRGATEYSVSTIPGSVNHHISIFNKGAGSAEFDDLLESLGAKRRGDVGRFTRWVEKLGLADTSTLTPEWDFSEARELIIWSAGPTCKLSPNAVKALYEAGYPAEKLGWYRGGLPAWQYWGFTTAQKPRRR